MSRSTTIRPLRGDALTEAASTLVTLTLVVAASFGACSTEDNIQSCTLIGCVDQVTLRALDPSGALIAKVQGTVIADGKTIAVNCLSGTGGLDYGCSPNGLVVMTSAASLVVSLSSGDLAVSGLVVTPSYVTTRPNGPKCDPICKQAIVDVQLGGGLVDAVGTDATSMDTTSMDTTSMDTTSMDTGETDGGVDADLLDATTDAGLADTLLADAVTADTSDVDGSVGDVDDTATMPPGCCKTTADCAKGHVCAGTVCKDSSQLKSGECWVDADCATGTCESPTICPCGASCFAPDKPGSCSTAAKCSKIDPFGYGLCEMLMGVGWDGAKCVFVSGCGCKEDCAKFFKDMAACEAACVNAK